MNTAVLGVGRMGQRHLAVAGQLQLKVVGIYDVAPAALDAACREHNLPSSVQFTDVAQLLKTSRPECVVIATHANSHCQLACQAAEAGAKYILCEKPMGVSLAECDRMLDVCQRHGARIAINHQMRFMEQYTRPKAIVTSEAFGGLSSVTVVAGNFGMAMNASHYFEMFRYLTDEPPHTVTAWFSETKLANPRGPQFEDRSGAVRVTTPRGKRLYMEISEDQGHGMHVTYAGPCGRLTVDELAGTLHLAVRKPEHRVLPTTRYGMPWDETTEKIAPADVIAPTKAVLSALLAGKNYPSGEDGRLAVEVLAAAYASHEQGHAPIVLGQTPLARDRTFPWA